MNSNEYSIIKSVSVVSIVRIFFIVSLNFVAHFQIHNLIKQSFEVIFGVSIIRVRFNIIYILFFATHFQQFLSFICIYGHWLNQAYYIILSLRFIYYALSKWFLIPFRFSLLDVFFSSFFCAFVRHCLAQQPQQDCSFWSGFFEHTRTNRIKWENRKIHMVLLVVWINFDSMWK